MSIIEKRMVRRPNAPSIALGSLTAPNERAVVGIVHGYADYGARYAHVMKALAERGISSMTLDLRGHGDSEGERGNCETFDDFASDMRVLDDALAEKADLPKFLLGHSFGGLVATTRMLSSQEGFRGLLLSGPFFGLALEVPKPKQLLGRLASKLAPSLGLPAGIKGSDLTHDEKLARAYDADPLVFKLAKARWFRETEKAQERVRAEAGAIRLPCRVVFGGSDKVASLRAARSVFDTFGSKDKEFVEEEGLFHEVLNEPAWPRLVTDLADWMLARID